MNEAGHVKVFFLYEGESTGDTEVESMWALGHVNGYMIDNIPFHVRGVALGDVVAVRVDDEGLLWFDHLVAASGHSTIRLLFGRENDMADVRTRLSGAGCGSELSELPRLVAVDVPPDVDYDGVRGQLEGWEASGILEYEEGCLGQVAKPR